MKNKTIPVWTYLPEYKKEKKYIFNAVNKVFDSGRLILGQQVEAFEKKFASYCNRRYGIGVNSGTDAIFLALNTLDIGTGDEVITVSNTAIPTVTAIAATGATPVFVEIDPKTYLIDTTKIEERITKYTRCIVPVHLYGQCCDMDAISKIAQKHNLFVVEDCAQAHGAGWNGKISGSMSDLAAFSFYPTKILGAFGDAGMIVTDSRTHAKKAKMLRMYGTDKEYYSNFLGYNSRLDEIHAAILLFKLGRLPFYIKRRRAIAQRYYKALKDTPLTLPYNNPQSFHSYYLFVCAHERRDEIIEYAKKHNIIFNISYKYPVHMMKGFQYLGYRKGDIPITEKLCNEIFSLPMYPQLTWEEQKKVIKILRNFFNIV